MTVGFGLDLVEFPTHICIILSSFYLGVFTFFAIKGVAYGLREVVRLTEVSKQPPCPRKHARSSEDGIGFP